MTAQSSKRHAPRRHERGSIRVGLLLALIAGALALALALGYLARTRLVLGPIVHERLESMARARGINLQVSSLRPVGLLGVRLEQVQVTAQRGSYLVEADLDAVEITPSLDELMHLQVHPAAVEIDGGRLRITRRPAPPTPPPSDAPTTAPPKAPSRPDTSAAPAARPPTLAIVHDLSVSVRPGPLPATTRPLVLHRAEVELGGSGARGIAFRAGYGVLPDGTPFAMRLRAAEADVYVIAPQRPTRLDRWFDLPSPVQASVDAVEICPECEPASVRLDQIQFRGPRQLSAQTEQLSILFGDRKVTARLEPLALRRADQDLPYRLSGLEAVYAGEERSFSVKGRVRDGDDGRASLVSRWSHPRGTLGASLNLDGFDTTRAWEVLGVEDKLEGGRLSGMLYAAWRPSVDLIEASVDLDTKNLSASVPVVTGDALDFEQLGVEFDAIIQPRARALSIPVGEAVLGDAGPIAFSGYAIDAEPGWIFEARANAEDLVPHRLLAGLPDQLAQLAAGADFDGKFGFDVSAAGHTAYAESLSLQLDFTGDVEVRGDGRRADVLALAADGPPSIELPGNLARNVSPDEWIDYDALPSHIPRVLTAAEDAQFFKHKGFDWRGLRRALVHNIRAGGIERGGSTLSQQLSKNLFLDHDRTLARKLQEAYVTWRLESELSKERILELYMNLVEWGPNIQGLRQAAKRYFEVAPEQLDVEQVALLASVLPGPSLFGQQVLSGYLPASRVEKIEHILSNLRFLRVISSADYRYMYAGAKSGEFAGLELVVCDDEDEAADMPTCP